MGDEMRKNWKRIVFILLAYVVLAGHTSCEDVKERPGQIKKRPGQIEIEALDAVEYSEAIQISIRNQPDYVEEEEQ